MSTFYEVVESYVCRSGCGSLQDLWTENSIIQTQNPKLAFDVYIYNCYGISPLKPMTNAQKIVVQNCYQKFQKDGNLMKEGNKYFDDYCNDTPFQLILCTRNFRQQYDFNCSVDPIQIIQDQQEEMNQNRQRYEQKMEIQQLNGKVGNLFIHQQNRF